jgi:hypothetical protein
MTKQYLVFFSFNGCPIGKLLLKETALKHVKTHAETYFKIVRTNKLNIRIRRLQDLDEKSSFLTERCQFQT